MKRGAGYINPRATSGYTSLSVTKKTRAAIAELQRESSIASADELIYRLVRAELDGARSMESPDVGGDRRHGSRDSIDQRRQNGEPAGLE